MPGISRVVGSLWDSIGFLLASAPQYSLWTDGRSSQDEF